MKDRIKPTAEMIYFNTSFEYFRKVERKITVLKGKP